MNLTQDAVPLVKETWQEFQEDEAGQLGAALAYYATFSIFPLLLLLLAALGFVLRYWDNAIDAQEQILAVVAQNFSPQLSQTFRELLDVLKANEPTSGVNNHIFNGYIDGGFLIYHTPGYKVFVDDRCEVFGGAWLKEFVEATENGSGAAIARWEEQYGHFDYALTRTDTGFDDHFKNSAEWVCLKRTDTAAFYKRK